MNFYEKLTQNTEISEINAEISEDIDDFIFRDQEWHESEK